VENRKRRRFETKLGAEPSALGGWDVTWDILGNPKESGSKKLPKKGKGKNDVQKKQGEEVGFKILDEKTRKTRKKPGV